MDWEDTVMSEEELINAYEIDNPADDHAVGCHSLALKQAEITWKAREPEIVEARKVYRLMSINLLRSGKPSRKVRG